MENQKNTIFEFGIQPLDSIMEKMELKNTDLVRASDENITHKMVKKARSGRRLTTKVKQKIVNAINIVRDQRGLKQFGRKKLFNY
ncbi:MAG: hypothetical protein KKD07_02305 [Candidatus Omnitrophica bacterium]|nr:hypothetical protein [Candidatus Omnitrophota bacterium]MBU1997621.1 hypothetical protein [Candidatus Omnitrophota bacterium]MBU4333253.1 hypothetical protein [Candidatus Omnitrophota bacterium]